MTARAYLSDEKIGSPPSAAVLSLCQMFFYEKKNPAKNPIDRLGSPPFSRIFNGWQSLLAAVTLTAFKQPGKPPFLDLPILAMFLYLWKNTHFETDFSLLVELVGSQVVVSMFTCSRRPPIFDLPGCHARFDLPECQQDLEIVDQQVRPPVLFSHLVADSPLSKASATTVMSSRAHDEPRPMWKIMQIDVKKSRVRTTSNKMCLVQ